MKTCSYCQRPQRGGFYRTNQGKIYCPDCYIREKERLNNKKNSDFEKYQQELKEYTLLQERINEIFKKISYERLRESRDPDETLIKQWIEEENRLKMECVIRFGKNGPSLRPPQLINARYFESEEAETEYLTQQKIEEEKRQEEERRKAEEAEKKRLKEEQEAKKRAEAEAKKAKEKAKKEQVEQYIACPKCGRKIRANSVMCPHCYVKVGNYKTKPYDDNKRKHRSCGCIVFIILLLLAGGFVLLTNL